MINILNSWWIMHGEWTMEKIKIGTQKAGQIKKKAGRNK